MNPSRALRWLTPASAIVVGTAIAACGSPTASTSTTGSYAKDISYASQQVSDYEGAPSFVSPGAAFDIAKVRGKKIAVIPATSNQYDNTIEAQMKKLAAQYGVQYTEYPNQGQPTQWVSEMNEAIATRPNLIILNTALDPRQLLPEVEEARALHIPVMATHFFDQSYSDSLHTSCGGPATLCQDGLTATVNAPFDLATRIEADWIIADSKAQAHVLVITANDSAPTAGMVAAARSEFASHCPACKVTVSNVLVSDWPTKIPSLVATAVTRDPDLHYILPLFDFGAPYAATGIATAGKTGQVKIVTYNGTQSVLSMLESHDAVTVDVGEPLNWLAYAFMDQAFRILAGVPTVQNEHTPIRVFTATNVAATGTPPTVTGGYGNAYVAGYLSLWRQG